MLCSLLNKTSLGKTSQYILGYIKRDRIVFKGINWRSREIAFF